MSLFPGCWNKYLRFPIPYPPNHSKHGLFLSYNHPPWRFFVFYAQFHDSCHLLTPFRTLFRHPITKSLVFVGSPTLISPLDPPFLQIFHFNYFPFQSYRYSNLSSPQYASVTPTSLGWFQPGWLLWWPMLLDEQIPPLLINMRPFWVISTIQISIFYASLCNQL